MEAQPRQTVVEFAAVYTDATEALGDYSDGVEAHGQVWSEDSTEDLYSWIVGQGHDFWAAVIAGEHAMADVVDMYLGRPSPLGAPPVQWTDEVTNPAHTGYQAPWCIAHGVYYRRFGEEIESS